ncbi:OprO/OprP family phosphate-selective porin [Salinisphaera sp. Q1T1-3]|uniref:OprO/OprP family phosphate-selective porin n=1 Tax=Salinisphaera sp. Q1T1-3 TaxID=2321229 RepID=UPI00131430D6|nr:porin [Salinisphaera sp. Q1T1-3]
MIKIHRPGCLLLAGTAGLGIAMSQTAIAANEPSNADLARLVQQQAAQIQQLKQRLQAVEQQEKTSRQTSVAATSRPVSASDSRKNAPSVPDGQAAKPAASEGNDAGNATLSKRVAALESQGLKVDWSDGAPEFSSADGQYSFGIGGRVQYDFSTTSGSRYDGAGDEANLNSRNITGTEFRRVRLDAHGQITDPILYKVELDFAGNDVTLRDAYLAAQKKFALGKGTIYLGNKRADLGLDAGTSSKWTWFTERNTVANAILSEAGTYNTGAFGSFNGHDWHYSLGVTKGGTSTSNRASNNFEIASRAHWDPIDTGNTIVHLGVNGFYEDIDRERQDRIASNEIIAGHYNGNLRVASAAVDDPKSSHAFGFELAGLTGPFAAGAEWGRRDIESRNGPGTHYTAYAGQVGYSLTGEAFGYSTSQGVWTHPDVAHPVGQGGWGAWQLVARYQALDFQNSGQYRGGTGHATSVGLDWYLNDWVRGILDYSRWQTNNRIPLAGTPDDGYYGADDGNTVNARAQIVF